MELQEILLHLLYFALTIVFIAVMSIVVVNEIKKQFRKEFRKHKSESKK